MFGADGCGQRRHGLEVPSRVTITDYPPFGFSRSTRLTVFQCSGVMAVLGSSPWVAVFLCSGASLGLVSVHVLASLMFDNDFAAFPSQGTGVGPWSLHFNECQLARLGDSAQASCTLYCIMLQSDRAPSCQVTELAACTEGSETLFRSMCMRFAEV